MNLVKYGSIFVSAGIAITGVFLWDGANKRAMAESEAELLAAVVEREQVAYLFGTNAPAFTTNNFIQARKEWAVLYTKTMCGARDMTIDNDPDFVYWVDPRVSISDGDTMIESGGSWTVTEGDPGVYAVAFSGATNATALFHSTGSRLNDDSALLMPDVSTNETAPIIDLFYTGANYATNALFAGGHNNWWQEIGIDTNVYKYFCEKWNQEFEKITITKQTGSGFTLSPLTNEITEVDQIKTISVNSTSTNTNNLRAELYKITAPGRADAWFVASDGGGTGSLVLDKKTLTLTESGAAGTIGVKLAANPVSDFVITVGGSINGFTKDKTSLTFTSANWSTYQYITITPIAVSAGSDQCGFVALLYLGTTAELVAIKITNDVETNNDIIVDPALLSIAKLGSGSFNISFGTNTIEAAALTTSKRVITNNLMEARNVLTNLVRSTVVFNPVSLSYTNRTTIEHIHNSYAETNSYDTWDFDAALAVYNTPPAPDDIATNVVSYTAGDLLYVDADISISRSAGSTDWSRYDIGYNYYATRLTGCSLSYPCDYAFASNYVARLRVYLCLAPRIAVRYDANGSSQYWDDPDTTHMELDSSQPWHYESYGYGYFNPTNYSTRSDGSSTVPADTGEEMYGWGFGLNSSSIIEYRLVEVVDAANPSARPTFDIGPAMAECDFTLQTKTDWQVNEWISLGGYENSDTSDESYYFHATKISIYKIIVVVDWNWKHLTD